MSAPAPSPALFLRKATAADVPLILRLIHALAAYEREPPSTVEATEESLARTLGLLPDTIAYAQVILAFTPEGQAAGMALYYNSYSTWKAAPGIYLEDLIVFEEFRGRGVGTALLAALAREVKSIGGKRVEWSVLKWNAPSIKFYEGLEAFNMGVDWQVMRVAGDALDKLAARGPAVEWN